MNIRSFKPDHELEFIANLLAATRQNGFCNSETSIVNLYVALKSKPMAILIGPQDSGKIAAVQCLSRVLLSDQKQCQFMDGHPWTFRKSENLAMFTEVYTRFNTEKLLWLIEESWRPANVQRVFIACLTHISPGELLSYFTEVAFQLRHGQLMRLGDIHFNEPIPYPPNLILIGTMDTLKYDWLDSDLLSMTTVVQWPISSTLTLPSQNGNASLWEKGFLTCRVRLKQTAYHKVHSVLQPIKQPLMPLLQIDSLLRENGMMNLSKLVDEVMLYLANSWTRLGNGLFEPSITRNFKIAFDLAIVQIILPRAADVIRRNKTLHTQLFSIVNSQFPRTAVFLQTLGEQALTFG